MIESKIKKAIFTKDLDFDVSNYMDWMQDDNYKGFITMEDLDYQLEIGIDQGVFMPDEQRSQFVKLYKFCKENKVEVIL